MFFNTHHVVCLLPLAGLLTDHAQSGGVSCRRREVVCSNMNGRQPIKLQCSTAIPANTEWERRNNDNFYYVRNESGGSVGDK